MEKPEPQHVREEPMVDVVIDLKKDPVLRRLMRRTELSKEEIDTINAGGAMIEDWKKVKPLDLKAK